MWYAFGNERCGLLIGFDFFFCEAMGCATSRIGMQLFVPPNSWLASH